MIRFCGWRDVSSEDLTSLNVRPLPDQHSVDCFLVSAVADFWVVFPTRLCNLHIRTTAFQTAGAGAGQDASRFCRNRRRNPRSAARQYAFRSPKPILSSSVERCSANAHQRPRCLDGGRSAAGRKTLAAVIRIARQSPKYFASRMRIWIADVSNLETNSMGMANVAGGSIFQGNRARRVTTG